MHHRPLQPVAPRAAGILAAAVGLYAICLSGCTDGDAPGAFDSAPRKWAVLESLSLPGPLEEAIRTLDPEHISQRDVAEVLACGPAPRIMCIRGSMAGATMESFARFLAAMGYPGERLRNPADGSLTYGSYARGEPFAGLVAWCYERDGMAPMLIGHSQGGMMAIKVLYELAGERRDEIDVWDPVARAPQGRHAILDPLTGLKRPVVGLKVGYASAIATGRKMRVILGQWGMIGPLRKIPDAAEEFTGFFIQGDALGGEMSDSNRYEPMGKAVVHNVNLPRAGHVGIVDLDGLAEDPAARDWIARYVPGRTLPAGPQRLQGRAGSLLLAAETWYYVKKHWCIEAQRLIQARRAHTLQRP